MDVGVVFQWQLRSYRADGLVTLGVPQNCRRKVITLLGPRLWNFMISGIVTEIFNKLKQFFQYPCLFGLLRTQAATGVSWGLYSVSYSWCNLHNFPVCKAPEFHTRFQKELVALVTDWAEYFYGQKNEAFPVSLLREVVTTNARLMNLSGDSFVKIYLGWLEVEGK
jgi:hypothetical protein